MPEESRYERQNRIAAYAVEAFGDEALSIPQRGLRLLEEALEAYQATGASQEMAHQLVDFVFRRPIGEMGKEIGQVGVTLLLLANATNRSADLEEAREIARIAEQPPSYYRARNATKNAAGFKHNG